MPVIRTTVRRVGAVVDVTLADTHTGEDERITATLEHPFYVDGKGYVDAGKLQTGERIITLAGPELTVAALEQRTSPKGWLVYNAVIDVDHTYFVGQIDGGAWVHTFMRTCLDAGTLDAAWARSRTSLPGAAPHPHSEPCSFTLGQDTAMADLSTFSFDQAVELPGKLREMLRNPPVADWVR